MRWDVIIFAIGVLGLVAGSNSAQAQRQGPSCTSGHYSENERWLLQGGGFPARELHLISPQSLPESGYVEVTLAVDHEVAITAGGGYYDQAVGGWYGVYSLSQLDARDQGERFTVDGQLWCCGTTWIDSETGSVCTDVDVRGEISRIDPESGFR